MSRTLQSCLSASLEKRHWKALINIALRCRYPFDFIARYLFNKYEYPHKIFIKNGKGDIPITVYSWHDILTVNEIFFREDYYTPKDSSIIVDLGSNIGISALYFLTQSNCRVYMYEPVPSNLEKLYWNIKPYAHRCEVHPVAIGPFEGTCSFGIEATGRYGGLGLNTGTVIDVQSVSITQELIRVLEIHNHIDVLKMDVESMEFEMLHALDDTILKKIRYIHVEFNGELKFSKSFFALSKRGTVYSLKNTLFTIPSSGQ
jgi:FkbM family methyltransferase